MAKAHGEQQGFTEGSDKAPPLTRRQRFKKYAPKRTQQVVKALRTLRNCSNTSSYEFTEGEVDQMLSAIADALGECREAFAKKAGVQRDFKMNWED